MFTKLNQQKFTTNLKTFYSKFNKGLDMVYMTDQHMQATSESFCLRFMWEFAPK